MGRYKNAAGPLLRPHDRGWVGFAFYGRVSTQDYQDPVSSRRWQFDFAAELVAGHGRIVAEYFDIGYSREVAWADRPEANKLLAAISNPDRGFEAIVVGEYARAFHGSQAIHLAPLLRHHGVGLWLPEVDGPVDLESPTHQALLMLLGARAKQEVQRARFRSTAAMQAQAREQGRHLGGRPPYGYCIVDAGAHPNSARGVGSASAPPEPDPQTAPWVRWIFARRLEGYSIAGIARMLNEMSIPCPSAVDRERNPHRPGQAWRQRTVAAIVANPRYTGRQVWNRQDHEPDAKSPALAAAPATDPKPARSTASGRPTDPFDRHAAPALCIDQRPATPTLSSTNVNHPFQGSDALLGGALRLEPPAGCSLRCRRRP